MKPQKDYWVYVIQGQPYTDRRGKYRKGPFYVGLTVDVHRRLRQHQGEIKGGAKSTKKNRPWSLEAVYGPYLGRSDATKAERALKRGKRGKNRTKWLTEDSEWCRGLGAEHPWVEDQNWSPPA